MQLKSVADPERSGVKRAPLMRERRQDGGLVVDYYYIIIVIIYVAECRRKRKKNIYTNIRTNERSRIIVIDRNCDGNLLLA